MKNEIINTHDWELKIFGGLSKNQIRELSDGLFGSFVFATLKEAIFIDENETISLSIELANANIKDMDNNKSFNYVKELSLNSESHNFNFKNYYVDSKMEDLHGYEPSKIPVGTYSEIKTVFIILEAVRK